MLFNNDTISLEEAYNKAFSLYCDEDKSAATFTLHGDWVRIEFLDVNQKEAMQLKKFMRDATLGRLTTKYIGNTLTISVDMTEQELDFDEFCRSKRRVTDMEEMKELTEKLSYPDILNPDTTDLYVYLNDSYIIEYDSITDIYYLLMGNQEYTDIELGILEGELFAALGPDMEPVGSSLSTALREARKELFSRMQSATAANVTTILEVIIAGQLETISLPFDDKEDINDILDYLEKCVIKQYNKTGIAAFTASLNSNAHFNLAD